MHGRHSHSHSHLDLVDNNNNNKYSNLGLTCDGSSPPSDSPFFVACGTVCCLCCVRCVCCACGVPPPRFIKFTVCYCYEPLSLAGICDTATHCASSRGSVQCSPGTLRREPRLTGPVQPVHTHVPWPRAACALRCARSRRSYAARPASAASVHIHLRTEVMPWCTRSAPLASNS